MGSTWLCNYDEQIEFQPKSVLRYEEGRAETADVQYPSPDRVTIIESDNQALAFAVKIAEDALELKDIADGDVLECSRTDAVIPYKELKQKVCAEACSSMLAIFEQGKEFKLAYEKVKSDGNLDLVRRECTSACSGGGFASCVKSRATAAEIVRWCYPSGPVPKAEFEGYLRARKERFCRAADECKQSGQCHPTATFLSMEPEELRRPAPLGPMALMHCEPKSDEDCAASAGCKSYRACKLKAGFGSRNDCQSGR